MVDDLISMGTMEPYRMFTSRAEYRLLLREDNADLRLTEIAHDLGLISEERWKNFSNKRLGIEQEMKRLSTTWVQPNTEEGEKVNSVVDLPLSREYSLMDLIKRPGISYNDIAGIKGQANDNPQVSEQVEIQIKYSGYIERQSEEIARSRRFENTIFPTEFDYQSVEGLSNEIKQKLSDARPETLARASRIPGVTPAAISLLLIYLKKHGALEQASQSA
jgi:tRNA uridine 5-carboxymethylaminomethyl modification enzyme